MDRRLLIEFLPAIVFLGANALWGLFPAAAAALAATVVAVFLRFRIDGQAPFLAIATLCLSLLMLGLGMAFDDEQFIKIRSTISGVAFAVILAVGATFRPSLLERSLGYKIIITQTGWRLLHMSWIGIALIFAALNELVWRNTSTDTWVLYSTLIGPVAFALYFGATWAIAWEYWDEDEEEEV